MLDEKLKQVHLEYQGYLCGEKGLGLDTTKMYAQIVEEFLAYLNNHSSRLYLSPTWSVSELTGRTVQVFLEHLEKQRNWKRSTFDTHETALRSFFRFLVNRDYLEKNPLQEFRFKGAKEKKFIQEKTGNPDVVNRYLEEPCPQEFSAIRDRLLLEFAYGLVWRPKELSEILSAERIAEGQLKLTLPSSVIVEPFSFRNHRLFVQYQNEVEKLGKVERFWVNPKGQILTVTAIRQRLHLQLKALNLGLLDLRELATQQFLRNGADVRSVQRLRNLKKLDRLQSISKPNFIDLQERFLHSHHRSDQ